MQTKRKINLQMNDLIKMRQQTQEAVRDKEVLPYFRINHLRTCKLIMKNKNLIVISYLSAVNNNYGRQQCILEAKHK